MSVKRSRIIGSSSLGDVCMFDHAKPTESSSSQWKNRTTVLHSVNVVKPDQPRQKIWTLGSPLHESIEESSETRFDGQEVGSFLESCFHCKKRIGEKDEVFMYSYLRAFCSPECRDKQIGLDKQFGQTLEGVTEPDATQIGRNGAQPRKGAA